MTDVEKMRLRELEEEVQALKCLVTQNSGGGIGSCFQDFSKIDYTVANRYILAKIGYDTPKKDWIINPEGYFEEDGMIVWSANTNKSSCDDIPVTEEDEARGYYSLPTLHVGNAYNQKSLLMHYSWKQGRTYPICTHWVGFYKKGTYYLISDKLIADSTGRADLNLCKGNISCALFPVKKS